MSEAHAQLMQMANMLESLQAWLDKGIAHANAKKFDAELLLGQRLAPDMYPLRNQIQAACDGVKFLAARLSGRDAPKHEDGEQSLEQLRARLREVVAYARGFSQADFDGWESRLVPIGFLPGKGMLGADYLHEFVLPNTYFHLCMAYAILRHNGVELGKQDYIRRLSLRDR